MASDSTSTLRPKWLTDAVLKFIETDPHKVGIDMAISKLEKLLLLAAHMYYNTEDELISDTTFDILQNILKERAPTSKILKDIGAPVEVIGKAKLPFWMGSADKIKPASRELERWLGKYTGPYVISSKLDGLSGLLVYTRDGAKLYTRGDGTNGQDVSRLIEYIKVPEITLASGILAIRGEIIIKTKLFQTKYKGQYPKARSLVAGTVNASVKSDSKSFKPEIARDLEFITYEVVKCDNKTWTFQQQFEVLKTHGFTVAKHQIWSKPLDSDILSKTLLHFKAEEDYEIDGIIVADSSKYYPRAESGNPDYLVAFKMSLEDQKRTTTVVDIEWNSSKHGLLKPTVVFEPVEIGGDTIRRATGFNAAFINDNKLGVGSKIVIIKSGDVIPYINEVSTAAKETLMPDKKGIKWEWNDSNVDALLVDASTDVNVAIKRITHFMRTLGVVGVSEGIITRLFEAGYRNLSDVLAVPIDSIAGISGFSLKSGTTIYKAIHSVCDAPINLALLMDASNCFEGFGFKKLDLVVKNIPSVATKIPTEAEITSIAGFSGISAKKIISNLPIFYKWLKDHPMLKWEASTSTSTAPTGSAMTNQVVVMTGFRDDTISSWIEANGGKMGTAVSGKTTLLLVKDTASGSSKMEKARALGVEIMSGEDFKKKYKI
jgi:NAD-dependent DNA ligase